MQIERIYRPDMRCQMQAIVLILRITLPREQANSVKKQREISHSTRLRDDYIEASPVCSG